MYLKRFCIEKDIKLNTRFSFIGEHEAAKYLSFCTDVMPRLLLSYQVSDAGNSFPDDEVNVEEFIGIKSFKAKGKRLSNREIESFQWLEPFEPEVPETPDAQEDENPEEAIDDNLEKEQNDTTGDNTSGNGTPGIQMELF